MQKSKLDHFVFYKNSSSRIILLVIYVDDIAITMSDSKCISSLKFFFHNQFLTKDLGMLKYFLVVEVMRSKQGILFFQRKYVLRQGNWVPNLIVLLWLLMCSLLRKENYLKILEDWSGN